LLALISEGKIASKNHKHIATRKKRWERPLRENVETMLGHVAMYTLMAGPVHFLLQSLSELLISLSQITQHTLLLSLAYVVTNAHTGCFSNVCIAPLLVQILAPWLWCHDD
jgi:hypothetical protein